MGRGCPCLARAADRGSTNGGWTAAWLVALWARLFEPEKASAVIQDYLSRLVSDNLLHRDGDIFQIDANFGMTGCIPELLLQSHTDVIRVLPAVRPTGRTDRSTVCVPGAV
jgi:alpha-L-fucosidase 2